MAIQFNLSVLKDPKKSHKIFARSIQDVLHNVPESVQKLWDQMPAAVQRPMISGYTVAVQAVGRPMVAEKNKDGSWKNSEQSIRAKMLNHTLVQGKRHKLTPAERRERLVKYALANGITAAEITAAMGKKA